MTNADSFRINIADAAIHRLTSMVLDVSHSLHNTNVPIHEIFCVIPPPYYLDCFERSYPNFPLNQYEGPFFLQRMNVIQGGGGSGQQRNQILDAVVTIIKYKKITN